MNTIETVLAILIFFVFGAETFFMGYSIATTNWFKKKSKEERKEKENKETIFKYTFADGTILRLPNVVLSADAVRKLEGAFGKCQNLIAESTEGQTNEIIGNGNLFLSRRTYWTNHSRN